MSCNLVVKYQDVMSCSLTGIYCYVMLCSLVDRHLAASLCNLVDSDQEVLPCLDVGSKYNTSDDLYLQSAQFAYPLGHRQL
jgi:hypothetical protein